MASDKWETVTNSIAQDEEGLLQGSRLARIEVSLHQIPY
jgi:hypothetical protein